MGTQDHDELNNPQRPSPPQGSADSSSTAAVRKTARAGAVGVTVFWLVLLAIVYLGVRQFEQSRAARFKPYAISSTEMVIPRSPDGHFYVEGEINGQAVFFLVDTGASNVVVTDAFAQQANLQGGKPTTFMTANGPRPGRILRNVPVLAGTLSAPAVEVGVGLVGPADDLALLGQSFLSKFDVSMGKDHMVIKMRAP
jgi:aspartyl protease family protein